MSKHNKIIIVGFIIGFLLGITIIQRLKIINLESNNKEDIEITLENCPICEGHPILQQVNQSFYIECEDCELRTNYFDSKYELIKYWNNRN